MINKLLLLLLLCSSFLSFAFDTSYTIRSQSRFQQTNESTLFPAQDASAHFVAVDLALEHKGLRLASTLWSEYANNESDTNLELSELFYDLSLSQWQISIGKKKIDWDVGYGFRPLDMFSPAGTLSLYTAVAPGSWLISGDLYTENGTITLICNQSQPNFSINAEKVKPGWGCGIRNYQYLDNWEVQALIHYDSKLDYRVGASALSVVNDNLEFHTSLLWQQSYQVSEFHPKFISQSEFKNPITIEKKHRVYQWMTGINYSTDNGINFILEYWFDGRSPKNTEWELFIASLPSQAKLSQHSSIVQHQLTAEKQMFSSHNLFQHNLMLNVRTKIENWQPELTILLNPVDKSLLFNPRICYDLDAGHQIKLGTRHYLGSSKSIYRQLDFDNTYYLELELVF